MSEMSGNRRLFAATLAKLVSPMNADDGTTAIVAILSACADIPEAVFNDPIRLGQKFGHGLDRVPTFRAMHKLLAEEAVRYVKALPLPFADEEGLNDTDRLWIKFWQDKAPGAKRAVAANYLSTVRRYAPAAFDLLCRENVEDADVIAVSHDWEPSWRAKQRYVTDWKDAERIKTTIYKIRVVPSQAIQAALMGFLRTAVSAHAPENLWLLGDAAEVAPAPFKAPPDPRMRTPEQQRKELADGVAAAFEAQHGRKPGTMSPEQLEAARKAQGVTGPEPPKPKPVLPRRATIDWGNPSQ